MKLVYKLNVIIDNKLKIRYINRTWPMGPSTRFSNFAQFQFLLNKFLLDIFHLIKRYP